MRVGGRVDALPRAVLAILFFQPGLEQAERNRRLGRRARLGNHVHRKITIADDIKQVLHISGTQVVSRKINFSAFIPQLVAERAFDKFQPRPRAKVAAADADRNQHLALLLDTLCSGLNPGEFLPVIGLGQVEPAQHFTARA